MRLLYIEEDNTRKNEIYLEIIVAINVD